MFKVRITDYAGTQMLLIRPVVEDKCLFCCPFDEAHRCDYVYSRICHAARRGRLFHCRELLRKVRGIYFVIHVCFRLKEKKKKNMDMKITTHYSRVLKLIFRLSANNYNINNNNNREMKMNDRMFNGITVADLSCDSLLHNGQVIHDRTLILCHVYSVRTCNLGLKHFSIFRGL